MNDTLKDKTGLVQFLNETMISLDLANAAFELESDEETALRVEELEITYEHLRNRCSDFSKWDYYTHSYVLVV